MFEDAGITKDDKVVTYCTAGIRSGYMQLILEMCGFKIHRIMMSLIIVGVQSRM